MLDVPCRRLLRTMYTTRAAGAATSNSAASKPTMMPTMLPTGRCCGAGCGGGVLCSRQALLHSPTCLGLRRLSWKTVTSCMQGMAWRCHGHAGCITEVPVSVPGCWLQQPGGKVAHRGPIWPCIAQRSGRPCRIHSARLLQQRRRARGIEGRRRRPCQVQGGRQQEGQL